MMGMMEEWAEELPEFREYLTHKFVHQKTRLFGSSTQTKVVPLKELQKELFHPIDQNNKDIIDFLRGD